MAINLNPDLVPPVKLGLHGLQIVLSFVIWCMEIAVFRGEDAKITGPNGWTFGVCFLSIPAWIFLVMTPRFTRTRRYANPQAMLAVDGAFIIIWISAFATQAYYNNQGDCGKACGISKAIVGLGVFVALLFGGSTFLSAFTLFHFNQHGELPGYDNRQLGSGENIDPDKAAFSMAPHDDEAYERVNMDDHEPSGYAGGGGSYNSQTRYGDGNPYSAEDDDVRYGAMPPRNNNTLFESETEYQGNAPPSMPYNPPAGHSYSDSPALFPSGNYDRTTH